MLASRVVFASFACVLLGTIGAEKKEVHFRLTNETKVDVSGAEEVKGASVDECLKKCALKEGCSGGMYAPPDSCMLTTGSLKESKTPGTDGGNQTSFLLVKEVKEKECETSFTDLLKGKAMPSVT
uniref:Apple domain-containing protein n=1 Tax=Steinernema glaseri TaxID=37863 RepID=A0A1I7Y539_9BILA